VNVHLDVHGDRGLEERVGLEGGDVAQLELDEVAQPGLGGEGPGGLDVGGCAVDADDVVCGASGDLACGAAESGADVQDPVAVGQCEGGDQ
jgi:hypothetical protein